jgi:CYTH domain-containing protein
MTQELGEISAIITKLQRGFNKREQLKAKKAFIKECSPENAPLEDEIDMGMLEAWWEKKLRAKLAPEIADLFTYLDLFATRQNVVLPVAIANKFNEISKQMECPQFEIPTESVLINPKIMSEHRPLVNPQSKFKPVKELYNGFEIEKKFILATVEEDHTKNKNALTMYNEVLEKGTEIRQGYVKDFSIAHEMLQELGIELTDDFRPNTVRLRQYGDEYILTLKDKKETKRKEVEWGLDKKVFMKFWKHTKGSRVYKKRLIKKLKGFAVEYDAFTDRFLLLAEVEVTTEADLKKVPRLGMDVTNNSQWSNKNLSR